MTYWYLVFLITLWMADKNNLLTIPRITCFQIVFDHQRILCLHVKSVLIVWTNRCNIVNKTFCPQASNTKRPTNFTNRYTEMKSDTNQVDQIQMFFSLWEIRHFGIHKNDVLAIWCNIKHWLIKPIDIQHPPFYTILK